MARKLAITGIALEVHSRQKDDKIYNSLLMFEKNQKYPELIKLGLLPEQIPDATRLVGKIVTVEAEMSEYNGRVNYYFRGSAS